MDETRVCKRCNGTKQIIRREFVLYGKIVPESISKCDACDGAGYFPSFNKQDIEEIVLVDTGKKKLLQPVFPTNLQTHYKERLSTRAFYVWLYAKAEIEKNSIPYIATKMILSDPFVDELSQLAKDLTKKIK